jgi:hypothetical protein
VLWLGVALFARRVGFDRDHAFYPTADCDCVVLRVVCSDARIGADGVAQSIQRLGALKCSSM